MTCNCATSCDRDLHLSFDPVPQATGELCKIKTANRGKQTVSDEGAQTQVAFTGTRKKASTHIIDSNFRYRLKNINEMSYKNVDTCFHIDAPQASGFLCSFF